MARGEAWIGLTDSDDIAAEQREGAPLLALPLTEESLLIPNTVAVIRDGPNPEAGQRLWLYLQRPLVAETLVAAQALESASAQAPPAALTPNWDKIVGELDDSTDVLKGIFLR